MKTPYLLLGVLLFAVVTIILYIMARRVNKNTDKKKYNAYIYFAIGVGIVGIFYTVIIFILIELSRKQSNIMEYNSNLDEHRTLVQTDLDGDSLGYSSD